MMAKSNHLQGTNSQRQQLLHNGLLLVTVVLLCSFPIMATAETPEDDDAVLVLPKQPSDYYDYRLSDILGGADLSNRNAYNDGPALSKRSTRIIKKPSRENWSNFVEAVQRKLRARGLFPLARPHVESEDRSPSQAFIADIYDQH